MPKHNVTGIYAHQTGAVVLAHQMPDGNWITIWPTKKEGQGPADLLQFRHDMNERPAEDGSTYQLPGRTMPTLVLRRTPLAWQAELSGELRPAATTDDIHLTINSEHLNERLRAYLGLPRRSKRTLHGRQSCRAIAFEDGDITLVKMIAGAAHLLDPPRIAGRGLLHIAGFQRDHDDFSEDAPAHRLPNRHWATIRRMNTADFDRWSRQGRTIAEADPANIRINLRDLWPMDRHYFGLIAPPGAEPPI